VSDRDVVFSARRILPVDHLVSYLLRQHDGSLCRSRNLLAMVSGSVLARSVDTEWNSAKTSTHPEVVIPSNSIFETRPGLATRRIVFSVGSSWELRHAGRKRHGFGRRGTPSGRRFIR
jgi:hypothetical protein